MSTGAFAQSPVGTTMSPATAASLGDAVRGNEKALIDNEVLGNLAGSAGTTGFGVFGSGRLRTSDHDGLDVTVVVPSGFPELDGNGRGRTFSYESDEESAFINAVVALPGTVLGGQLKLAGFIGGNWLDIELTPNPIANAVFGLGPGQIGRADNESLIAGGTALWAHEGTYALGTVVGAWGETTLVDHTFGFDPVTGALSDRRFTYDTTGFIGSVTAGHVFPLAGSSGPMLDLRGSVIRAYHRSDRFQNEFTDQFKLHVSTWTGTAAATLFANIPMGDKSQLRPYVQGYVRHDWEYDAAQEFIRSGDFARTKVSLDQGETYGGVDAGLAYTVDNMNFGGSVYFESSSSEETFGGRLSASWALD